MSAGFSGENWTASLFYSFGILELLVSETFKEEILWTITEL